MLALPDDILYNILSFCHEKTIVTLSRISYRINKLVDDKFWCQLLVERKTYDDYTFCYQYNTDEVVYHKSCISREEINWYSNVSSSSLRNVETLLQLWNEIQKYPAYDNFYAVCKNDKKIQCLSSMDVYNGPLIKLTYIELCPLQ